jgi:hypothetical protein
MNRKWTCSHAAPIVALVLLTTIGLAQQPVFIDKEPLGREAHSAVFDPNSKRMILFGGTTGITSQVEHLSDVWYLTGANSTGTSVSWIQANITGNGPSTRCCHSAVYNSTLNKMIVFGGAGGFANPTYNDVWVLNNANGVTGSPSWTPLSPTGTAPAPRFAHTAVYDEAHDIMIVFAGGSGARGVVFNDVWLLKNATGTTGTPAWSLLPITGPAPTARAGHTAVYNASTNKMIIYGGYASNGSTLQDIAVLSNANGLGSTSTWQDELISGPVLYGHSAVYDAVHDRMTVFGGYDPNTTQGYQNALWLLKNASSSSLSWEGMGTISGYALPTFGHTAVYDPVSNRMTIVGGVIQNGQGGIGWSNSVLVLTHANGLPIY